MDYQIIIPEDDQPVHSITITHDDTPTVEIVIDDDVTGVEGPVTSVNGKGGDVIITTSDFPEMVRSVNNITPSSTSGDVNITIDDIPDLRDELNKTPDAITIADISGLQELLDQKVDETDKSAIIKSGSYVNGQAYIYDASVIEYVNYVNLSSNNVQYQRNGWYRLNSNASETQTPESNPEIWIYNGTNLGKILIEDVWDLVETINHLLPKPVNVTDGNIPVFNNKGELKDSGKKTFGHLIRDERNDLSNAFPVVNALRFMGFTVSSNAVNNEIVIENKLHSEAVKSVNSVKSEDGNVNITIDDIPDLRDELGKTPEISITTNDVQGLQELLDSKMNKTSEYGSYTVLEYDPTKSYLYDNSVPEYVYFINSASSNTQFNTKGYYRLTEDAPVSENPETHQAHWKYLGTSMGDITISDVTGLTEALGDRMTKPANVTAGHVPIFKEDGSLEDSGRFQGGHIINSDGIALDDEPVLRFNGFDVVNENEQIIITSKFTSEHQSKLDNLSGINKGDETAHSIVSKLGNGETIDSTYLPSYVDDVIEGIYYPSTPEIPGYFQVNGVTITPSQDKIYVSTDTNTQYRWSGSSYISISNPISLANQSEAETGSENTKIMTSLRVFQAFSYYATNAIHSLLATTQKTIISAINELKSAYDSISQSLTNHMQSSSAHNASAIISTDNMTVQDKINDLQMQIDDKVELQAGMGLSKNNYTDEDKAKVAKITEHHKGVYISIDILNASLVKGVDGDYAIIDAGNGTDAITAIWDSTDNRWVKGTVSINGEITIADVFGLREELDGKVAKEPGMGLSQNSYTNEDKAKVAAMREHYKGTFISLEALAAAIPAGTAGDEAVIDAGTGTDAKKAVWDSTDNKWVIAGGGTIAMDAVPTAGSTNAVQSGGVKDELDAINAQLSSNQLTFASIYGYYNFI